MNPATAFELADWRGAAAALYARVRDQADPAAAHALWRNGRDLMMRVVAGSQAANALHTLIHCVRSGEIAHPGNDR
jgi:hypothetical protein